ncbi:MAG TPA: glycosyltransferase [Lacibacter sp.]|nr:glycosyltransferase [Lacibacter sp.]HMO88680.1 glycosyltransferase [Lacibacter sp.]HMP85661.1 glycosyltransferase [Lacibacter sp.]
MQEQPRLLFILNRLAIGGPAANTLALAAALSHRFRILLVAGEPLPGEQSAAHLLHEYKGFEVQMLPAFRRSLAPYYDWQAYHRLLRIIREFRPQIVHTHGSKPGLLGRLAAHRSGVPVIVHTFHGHVFEGYFGPLITDAIVRLERWLARRTTALIAINDQLQHDLTQHYRVAPFEQVYLNRLGIEWERMQDSAGTLRQEFRQEMQLQEEETAVTIIGRLVPVKQHKLFVELAQQVLQKKTAGQAFRFFIVGDGEGKAGLQELLRQKRLSYEEPGPSFRSEASFVFTSWRTDMQRVLAGTDILVLTSLNEGTPVSILEALAAARPVVATGVGGIPELLHRSGGGFACTDAAEMVQHLLRLAAHPEERQERGRRGSLFIKASLSINKQAEGLAQLYAGWLKKR